MRRSGLIGLAVKAAAISSLALASQAGAVVVTRSYTAVATFAVGSPYTTINQSFTLTFDPTVNVSNAAVDSYAASPASPPFNIAVGLSNTSGGGQTIVGGLLNGVASVGGGTDDFYTYFNVDAAGNVISSNGVGYTVSTSRTAFYNSVTTLITSLPVTPASNIPEPATWALMLVGFGGIGYAIRRNRKVAVSFS